MVTLELVPSVAPSRRPHPPSSAPSVHFGGDATTPPSTRSLTLSADHFVPVARENSTWPRRVMTRAKDVRTGVTVFAINSLDSYATGMLVQSVKYNVHAEGLFNPFTRAGLIVVNGVVASEYSEWILDGFIPALWVPATYHVMQMPVARLLYPAAPMIVDALSESLKFGGWSARRFASALFMTEPEEASLPLGACLGPTKHEGADRRVSSAPVNRSA